MPRGFSDVVDWSALLIDLWRHLDGSCPSWVNRYRSLAVEPDAKSAVARKLT